MRAWAVEWHSVNRLDGDMRYLYWPEGPQHWQLFPTRRECRAYIEKHCGYYRRPDLRAEPHGWRMPRAIRVTVQPATPSSKKVATSAAGRRGA